MRREPPPSSRAPRPPALRTRPPPAAAFPPPFFSPVGGGGGGGARRRSQPALPSARRRRRRPPLLCLCQRRPRISRRLAGVGDSESAARNASATAAAQRTVASSDSQRFRSARACEGDVSSDERARACTWRRRSRASSAAFCWRRAPPRRSAAATAAALPLDERVERPLPTERPERAQRCGATADPRCVSEPRAIDSSVGSNGARRRAHPPRRRRALRQNGDAAERDGLWLGGRPLR